VPGAFYGSANRVVYEKLCELYNKGMATDLALLSEELKSDNELESIGGYAFLVQISGRVPTTAQASYFIEKVRELHLLRELIKISAGSIESCYQYNGDMPALLDKVEAGVFALAQQRSLDKTLKAGDHVEALSNKINDMAARKGQPVGIPSGFYDLDKMTFGFQPEQIIILGARPAMGKSALALNIAENVVMPKKGVATPVLFFSLEMSTGQLMFRLACSRSRVDANQLKGGLVQRGSAEMQRVQNALGDIKKAPLFIDDTSSPTIMEIRAKARRMVQRERIGFIIVDYLQLMCPTDRKAVREQQVAEMSRGLKTLARELKIPILVLSQINRSAEKEDRPPRLSDLRESGSLEQDADIILFLSGVKDSQDIIKLTVAKQREGPTGDIDLAFLRNITRFENFTR
jgi:replicative DNA helicase